VEEEKKRECLGRYEGYLRRLGILTDALVDEVKEWALELMREAIARAEAEPEPDVGLIFEHAYAEPWEALRRDLEELRRILG